MVDEGDRWFGVRCVIHDPEEGVYEERVTIWKCADADEAHALAENEAQKYAEGLNGVHLGLTQSFAMFEAPAHGREVFSLVRSSALEPGDYLDQFFDTGSERQS